MVDVAKRKGRVARGLDTSLYHRCSSLLLSNVVDSVDWCWHVVDGRSLSSSRSLNPPRVASFGVRPLGSAVSDTPRTMATVISYAASAGS